MDLRLNLRELDDARLVSTLILLASSSSLPSYTINQNNNGIPDHMNLLSSVQADNHVRFSFELPMRGFLLANIAATALVGK